MNLYALYRIRNIETNMDYIGWSLDSINRVFKQHEKNDSYIGNAISLYGWDVFDVDVLHLVKTKKEVLNLEIEEIVKHNCRAPNGYNLTRGGEGGDTFSGKHHTEETKKKLRKVHRGKQYRKGKTGYKQTEEHIEKIRKALQGNKHGKGNRGKSKSEEWKQNKSKEMKGRKHLYQEGDKNCSHRTNVKIKRLKTRLKKLEQELNSVS